jgi:hypothetical protein
MTMLISSTGLSARIHTLPGREPFMLAADLAEAYGTPTREIVRAMKRNADWFEDGWVFQLTVDETELLKWKNSTSKMANRDLPWAFTREGATTLSGMIKSPMAAQVSKVVHGTFAAMEKRAFEQMRHTVFGLRNEVKRRSGLRVLVVDGVLAGQSFDAIWRNSNTTRPKLARVAMECLALGLIEQLPRGMAMEVQPDLFGEG